MTRPPRAAPDGGQQGDAAGPLRLGPFIRAHLAPILVDWEAFARTLLPPAATMSVVALRDHAEKILIAIATDMDAAQSETERTRKSIGRAPPALEATSAATHGAMRQLVGFDLNQLAAEFRALRASVLRRWAEQAGAADAAALDDVVRFSEGIDQALAESISAYSGKMAESRDIFLAVLGHDLRSPLGALANCVGLLRRDDLAAEPADRVLSIARRSVASMNGMITDLLEYTRTRLGRGIEIVRQPGDLAALCAEALEEARAAHPERAFAIESPASVAAEFDADRMRQVLSNLLNNAVQHGDPQAPIKVVVEDAGARAEVVVANRGKTIPPEFMQVIFDPLVQVARGALELHQRPATSLGLGLFIAQEIVAAHGGRIEVSSSDAEGTAFRVAFPRVVPAAP